MKRSLIALSALALMVSLSFAAPPRGHGRRQRGREPAPGYRHEHHPEGFIAWLNGGWFCWERGRWRVYFPGHGHYGEHRGWYGGHEPPWRHGERGRGHEQRHGERRGHGRHGPPGRP